MAAKTSEWRPGPTVCRCCLTEGCYKDISTEYFWMGKREVYAEMLAETFDLTIAYSQSGGPNSNSRLICEPCISRLRDAADFKRQVVECEKTFLQHLDPSSSSINAIEGTAEPLEDEKEVKLEQVKIEKLGSDEEFDDLPNFGVNDDDDDDDLDDDQPLTKLASKVPKKESVDLLDLIDNAKVTEKRKSTVKVKAIPIKKVKLKKETKASASKAKPEKKKKAPAKVRTTTSMWAMTLSERENAANFLLHTTLVPFTYLSYPFSFKCFYCTNKYSELSKLLEHSRNHAVPERAVLMKDFLKKGKKTIKADISELECKICNVTFTNLNDIREHLSCMHSKRFTEAGNGIIAFYLQTKNGVYTCHMCPDTFHSFFLLNKHINVHYSNAICESCGKGFVSHARLLQHKAIHITGQFPCDKCKKTFASLPKLKYHKTRVHGKSIKVKLSKCQLCETRFEHHYEKIKHLRDLHGMSYSYPCETCNIVFDTRKSLYFHTKKYHTQNIICDVCKKPFAERNHLKKHMAMHTKARNFACSLCSKTYRYEKNLKDHMRVHNPDWKFACSSCWMGFQNKIQFRKHMAESHS